MVLVGGFWGVDGCVWGYSRENEVNASFGWRDMGAWDWGFSQALSGVGCGRMGKLDGEGLSAVDGEWDFGLGRRTFWGNRGRFWEGDGGRADVL